MENLVRCLTVGKASRGFKPGSVLDGFSPQILPQSRRVQHGAYFLQQRPVQPLRNAVVVMGVVDRDVARGPLFRKICLEFVARVLASAIGMQFLDLEAMLSV